MSPAPSTSWRSRTSRRTALGAAAVLVAAMAPAVGLTSASAATGHTGTGAQRAAGSGPTYLDPKAPVRERVQDLLSRMTLQEKVGQMTQAERGFVFDNPSLITQLNLGGLLSGGGSTPPQNNPKLVLVYVDPVSDGLGRHDRHVPDRGAGHAPAHSDPVRHRHRAR